MTSIKGMVACGKRGGIPFLDLANVAFFQRTAPRIDPYTGECEPEYVPCSNYTMPSETVCVPINSDKSECPILDILVRREDAVSDLTSTGYKITENSYDFGDNQRYKIAFSKFFSQQYDFDGARDPIIDLVINTDAPCFGYERDKLILPEEG